MNCPCINAAYCRGRLGFNLLVYRDPCAIDLSQIPAETILPEGATESVAPTVAPTTKKYPWWILLLIGAGVYYYGQQG
jgi:hypothetical protein